MATVLLEVVVQSVDDALIAEKAGADRLELVCAIETGGLTPTVAMARAVCKAVQVPVRAMIRPRPGPFVYGRTELVVMAEEIQTLADAGVSGFVFGVLDEQDTINPKACRTLIRAAGELPCTFHRAFEVVGDPLESLEELIDLGFSTVLTSGQEVSCLDGAKLLGDLVKASDGRIEVLGGGKVRANVVKELIRRTGLTAVHQGPFVTVSDSGEEDKFGQGAEVRCDGDAVKATRLALS